MEGKQMRGEGSSATTKDGTILLLHPKAPVPGVLATLGKPGKIDEIREYEEKKELRIWTVSGIVSDTVPLAGNPLEILESGGFELIKLNENPLTIYLHSGGRNAIYYDLVGDENAKLHHIEVRVESRLPSNAILLALRPLNALLDVLARNFGFPILLRRVELISPRSGEPLVSEILLPVKDAITAGPMGGIIQAVPFAPYDAIYREALTSSSPFYRLLCAARIYEGANTIRKWLKERCEKLAIQARLPPELLVDHEFLRQIGFQHPALEDIHTAQDLFHQCKDMRDAIAHFLIERDGADMHVYLAEGSQLYAYASAAAALLHYAHLTLENLRSFYTGNIERHRGMVLPMIQNRDQFIVRAADSGLE
jgi:hypothetical protein